MEKIEHIFLDLDGLFANFEKRVVQVTKDHYWRRDGNAIWKPIQQVPNFFRSLEVMKGSLEILAAILDNYPIEKVQVLTALPRPTGLLHTAAEDKEWWVKQYMLPGLKVNTVEGGVNKGKWARDNPGALLIDDYNRNIEVWHECGGVGLQHTDVDSTLEKLKVLGVI